MNRSKFSLLLLIGIIFHAISVSADDFVKDAAIGGAVGGAIGAVIGAELDGKDGAIAGSAIGAAIGTATTTRDKPLAKKVIPATRLNVHPRSYHCPPGQAKKGKC